MIEGRRVLVVVPARGGSRGIPRKNLREVAGRSLVAWVGAVVSELSEVDRAVVSTDDDEIAAAAERAGLAAPFRRPAELSGDRVGDVPVLQHALRTTEELDGLSYDVIVMLQPTSPLRRADEVRACLRRLVDDSLDAVWTVSAVPLHHHPLKQLSIDDGCLRLVDERGRAVVARQELEPTYRRNGVAYALTRACLLEQGLLGPRTGAVVLDQEHLSIDDEDELLRADALLRARDEGDT